nr:IS30 family transposase [Microbacterium luteum]
MKKGPGRRPQSAKRQRFMQLREQGWSIAAAAREVGASRTAGHNWARGYKTYKAGAVVGYVPALDRREVRVVSARFLSQDERVRIADLHHAGQSAREIAAQLGRAPSTISRELSRNSSAGGGYRPFEAHRLASRRRGREHARRIDVDDRLREVVDELLQQRWSPQQISRSLRERFPDEPSMWLSHESIYQAVYRPGSALSRPSKLAPHRPSPLRTGRDHRKAQQRTDRRRPRFQQPMLTIHHRPFAPEDRSEAGHWEGDLIIGKEQGSAIGTLVERQTRTTRLLHLPNRDADALHAALNATMGDLPPGLLRSITWDQGTEMARHLKITETLGTPVFFCDSHSPWQRGTNENTNGLLRDYFPKGTDLSRHPAEHLRAVENELNNRPRDVLNGRSPATMFAALLASQSPSVLRR